MFYGLKKIVFSVLFFMSVCVYSQSIYSYPLIKKINPGAPLPANIFIQMAKIINPTVVNISTTQLKINDPFLEFFLDPNLPSKKLPLIQSLGTGFIVQSNGFILTNTHVINKAKTIRVQLENNKFYTAKVIGQDIYTDIALIKIETPHALPVAKLGNSEQLQVGEWIAAFGNPYGHGHSMVKGIVSAINRRIDDLNLFPFLQTDAIINPGNSGGPLVNLKGEVIGINTAMRTQGISFSIPIDNVKEILKDLKKYGHVKRGFIGVQMVQHYKTTTTKKSGALIVSIIKNTPAEKVGIKPGDIIISFNKRDIIGYKDLFKAVAATPINKTVPLILIRDKKQLTLNIEIAERIKKSVSQKINKQDFSKTNKIAPFNLGITIINSTKKIMQSIGLPALNRSQPIITKVIAGSTAAFAGIKKRDIILKVNGWQVLTTQDVQKRLSKYKTNTLNILRYRPHSRQYINMIIPLTVH